MRYEELVLKVGAIAGSLFATDKNSYCVVEDNNDKEILSVVLYTEDGQDFTLASFNYAMCLLVTEGDDLLPIKREVESIYEHIIYSKEKMLQFDMAFQLLCEYYTANFILAENGEFEVTGVYRKDRSRLNGVSLKTPLSYMIDIDVEINFVLSIKGVNTMFYINYCEIANY